MLHERIKHFMTSHTNRPPFDQTNLDVMSIRLGRLTFPPKKTISVALIKKS